MEQLPRQFLNAGVAEQNMTGVAAGMALSGKIAFTYSIGNFPTMRCLEHIRNDVCYHNANVKIVTVGGGFAYGAMGATEAVLAAAQETRAILTLEEHSILGVPPAFSPHIHAGTPRTHSGGHRKNS